MVKMQLIGFLGKDAQTSNVNGKTVINFSVAHTEKFKDAQGNQKDKTTWVDCSWWNEKTGLVPYLKKGSKLFVEGQPNVRAYANQSGQQGAVLTLRVSYVELLSTTKATEGVAQEKANNFTDAPNGFESDIPF